MIELFDGKVCLSEGQRVYIGIPPVYFFDLYHITTPDHITR